MLELPDMVDPWDKILKYKKKKKNSEGWQDSLADNNQRSLLLPTHICMHHIL